MKIISKNLLYIFLFITPFILFNCSSEDDIINVDPIQPNDPFEDIKIEYKINKSDLKIKNYGKKKINDIDVFIIVGSIQNKGWIGIYNYETKQNILDFTNNTLWPATGKIVNSQGKLEEIRFSDYFIFPEFIKNNLFILRFGNSQDSHFGYSKYYIINNSKLVNSLEKYTFFENKEYDILEKLDKYYNGFIFHHKLSLNNNNYYEYINENGEILFKSNILGQNPINYEESLNIEYLNSDISKPILTKFNLKYNTTTWSNGVNISPNSIYKITENIIDKENEIWTFTYKFIILEKTDWSTIEHKKYTKFSINIRTGKVEMISFNQNI